MKKLLLLVGVILICSSCTGVKRMNGDCFPGLRAIKWYKADKIK